MSLFLFRCYQGNAKKGARKYIEETMELSLDSDLVFISKTISDFILELSVIRDRSEKLSKLDDYVKRLEDEMRKIDVFKRELPLSNLLLNNAIGKLKDEAILSKGLKDMPVTEELISLNRNSDDRKVKKRDESSDKRSWLRSVQLWNSNTDCDFRKQDSERKLRSEEGDRSVPQNPLELCNYRNRGEAFVPYKHREVSKVPNLSLKPPISELGGSSISNSKSSHSYRGRSESSFLTEQVKLLPSKPHHPISQQQQSLRKQRRCWSPELHRRFIDALQQLGGSQVATPKQIRETMQVDGLTNDEVKSHLQKYRLHMRKIPPSSTQLGDHSKASLSQSGSPQSPLLVAGSGKCLISTGSDSMETEEDEKSDGHCWKGGLHLWTIN